MKIKNNYIFIEENGTETCLIIARLQHNAVSCEINCYEVQIFLFFRLQFWAKFSQTRSENI